MRLIEEDCPQKLKKFYLRSGKINFKKMVRGVKEF